MTLKLHGSAVYCEKQLNKVVAYVKERKKTLDEARIRERLLEYIGSVNIDTQYKHVMNDVAIIYTGSTLPKLCELAVFL